LKCDKCENKYAKGLCRAANIRFQTGMSTEKAWKWCKGKYFKPETS
jgi:hypothetical protein